MSEWTHNICERDWFMSPRFSAHESGGFRMPHQIRDPDGQAMNGICCMCGVPTVSGIFVRADEKSMRCQGDHEHPDMWSPFLGKSVTESTWPFEVTERQVTHLRRDDDYTPEAMDRTDR